MAIFTVLLTDAVNVFENLNFGKGKLLNLSDSVTLTDSPNGRLLTLYFNDNLNATDTKTPKSIAKPLLDTLIITEQHSHNLPNESLVMSDQITVSDSIRKLTFLVKSETVLLNESFIQQANISQILYDVVVTDETIRKFLPNAPGIVGEIELSGNVILNVYLLGSTNDVFLYGSRFTDVSLKGGLEVATKDQNFEMYAGDSKNLIVTVTDGNGSVVNLTGTIIKWRLTYSNGVIDKNTINGGLIITSPTNGVFTVKLTPNDTATLQGNFNHEVEMTDSAGNVSTLLVGLGHIYM